MKNLKKFAALLATAALMVALPSGNVLTASAAAPTTYLVCYQDDEWIYQVGVSAYNDEEDEENIEDLEDEIQNNDILIIDGSGEGVELDLSNVYLSNLTVMNADVAIVKTAGVNECYIGNKAVASVTGNVNSAWVYDTASVTFRSNVSYLELVGEEHEAEYNATCLGTVGHVKAAKDGHVYYEMFDVAAGRLNIEDGEDETDTDYYSETPGAAPAAPVAPVPAAPAQNATQNSAPAQSTTSGEYDEVPKTGEVLPAYVWLLGVAAVALAGKVALKKA
ncbi:MAG: hypothetical protein II994_03520 [Lachnospiraceae bacterium]|nr:hypothetical protein [Lachnospiraceae bacterium]